MLVAENSKLIAIWDYKLNGTIPEKLTVSSKETFNWLCEKKHSFLSTVVGRYNAKQSCIVCANKMIIAGVNDVGTLFPDLLKLWSTKNTVLISRVNPKSSKKYWFIFPCGHEFFTEVRKIVDGPRQCSYCTGQEVLKGFNDLGTVNPLLASEFDVEANKITASEIHNGARKKVWWICKQGHKWKTSVHQRKISQSECPYCTGRFAINGISDFSSTHPDLLKDLHLTKNNNIDLNKIKHGSHTKLWWMCDKGHEWKTYIYNRSYGKGCPKCCNNVSNPEKKLVDILEGWGEKVVTNNRKILKGLELDIYLPKKSIAIEYNGLYWHTENRGKDKKYHYNKWLACKKLGIQLIQIWEDDWFKNSDIIIKSLQHKLGISSQEKVFARKTKIVILNTKQARNFLNSNHIQGFASGTHYVGLNDFENKLQAVMVLKKEKNNGLNIIRYATDANVVGGFTKLLSYSEKDFKPSSFITFSDHCVSNGGLYENNGFVVDKEILPDYMYVVKGIRKHKFGYRLKRFKNDPELLWDETMSEKELAILNNLPRIWDAGKTRWIKSII